MPLNKETKPNQTISTQFKCMYGLIVKKQFSFKQFSLTWVHILIVKNVSISSYSVYSNSLIQFSISTQFKCMYGLIVKNISISNYSV